MLRTKLNSFRIHHSFIHSFILILLSAFTLQGQSVFDWYFSDCSDPSPDAVFRQYTHDFNDPLSRDASIFGPDADPNTHMNHIDIHGVTCAWDITKGSPDIKVGTTDYYFPTTHSELSGDYHYDAGFGGCFYDAQADWHHGLQNAGAITAKINNGEGITGVCDEVEVLAYCSNSDQNYRNAHQAAFDAGARIFTSSVYGGCCNPDPLQADMARDLTENGMVICQSGRGDRRASTRNIPGVIHVGRGREEAAQGRHWEYGNSDIGFDQDIDIIVLSEFMPRIEEFDTDGPSGGGSSIGTPFLAGIVALMRSANPCLPAAEVENILKETARDLMGDDVNNPQLAAGVVNAYEAVKAARDFEGVDETWTSNDNPVIDNRSVTGDLTVESGFFSINGNLYMSPGTRITVESGAIMLVSGSIRYGDDAEMIIERGGKVILDGGEFTKSWCNTSKWRGVRVEGNVNLPQPFVNGGGVAGSEKAGIFHVRNNSVIEYAKNAVRMRGSGYSWPLAKEYYGGLVVAENSTFRHNGRSVEFMKYGTSTNPDKSSFTNVTFDQHTTEEEDDSNQFCVTNWSSDGVTFDGCTFTNFDTGILTHNAAITVINGNTFTSLPFNSTHPARRAIEIRNMSPTTNVSTIGDINTAANNFSGGVTSICVNGEYSFNRMQIINNNFSNELTGIRIEGLHHFEIGDNDFNGQEFGCTLVDTGDESNVNRNNQFSSTNFGLAIKGRNDGYKFFENCFDLTAEHDVLFTVEGSSNFVSIDGIQDGGNGIGADNNFSGSGSSNASNAVDMSTNLIPLTYYAPATSPNSNYYPDVDNGNSANFTIELVDPIDGLLCGSSGFVGGGSEPRFVCNIPDNRSSLEGLVEELKTTVSDYGEPSTTQEKIEKSDYERCLRAALNALLKNYEETKSHSLAITKFQEENFDQKIKVYGMILDDNKLVEARDYLNTIATVATEEDEFKLVQNIYIDLLEAGEVFSANFNDTSADERGDPYAIVKEIALKENRLSCYARSLWFMLTGERIISKINRNELEEEGIGNTDAKKFVVYPNPVTNTLTIDMPIQETEVTIDIIDFTGKRIFSLVSNNGQVKMNTSSWNTGIYVLHVSNKEGHQLWQTKIVKL